MNRGHFPKETQRHLRASLGSSIGGAASSVSASVLSLHLCGRGGQVPHSPVTSTHSQEPRAGALMGSGRARPPRGPTDRVGAAHPVCETPGVLKDLQDGVTKLGGPL